ncbi:MAG TPA: DegT/DnrJ/EryC1/StrS family aminotransferase, partial [Kofleriaceae bacterium]
LGSFGALSTLSFHETKNCSCGEGGALIINDPALVERAEILHAKGTNRSRFLRGQVDKYTWVDVGSSFGLSDLLAALLLGQLEQRDVIQRHREEMYRRYLAALSPLAEARGWQMPIIPAHCASAFHMFAFLTRDLGARDRLIAECKANGVLAVFHYVPLHTSDMGERLGYRAGDLPVSEDVASRLVRLPFYNTLASYDQWHVIDVVTGSVA